MNGENMDGKEIAGCKIGSMSAAQQVRFGEELAKNRKSAPEVYEDMVAIAKSLGVEASLIAR